MPSKLAQACRVMGCQSMMPCQTHGRKVAARQYDRARGSAASRGYGRRWRAYVGWLFAELWRLKVPRAGLCGCRHPSAPVTSDSRCMMDGLSKLAEVVDHIVPVKGKNDPTFYDTANHQLLCHACHNAKRQRESLPGRR